MIPTKREGKFVPKISITICAICNFLPETGLWSRFHNKRRPETVGDQVIEVCGLSSCKNF